MIEINLIPDVKRDLLKAQRLRNLIIFASTMVSFVSIGLIVALGLFVFLVQPVAIGYKESEIESRFKDLKRIPDSDSIIVLQNQLNQIDNLRKIAPNTSRILGQIIVGIQTKDQNAITYSNINYEPTTKILQIDGETKGGFSALEAFQKTINETQIVYRTEHKEASCTVDDVKNRTNDCIAEPLVESDLKTLDQSLGDDKDGAKTLRFRISFKLNSKALLFDSKDFAILPPNHKDVTDSRTQIPDDIFKARSTDGGKNE